MAISIFFYCEIYIFSVGVFLNKICGPGGYNIAPCPIDCAWWAESNDTTLDYLAPPEDPHPTLPVIDQSISSSGIASSLNLGLCYFKNFYNTNEKGTKYIAN